MTASALVEHFEYSVRIEADAPPKSSLFVYFRGSLARCVPSLGFVDAQSYSTTPGVME